MSLRTVATYDGDGSEYAVLVVSLDSDAEVLLGSFTAGCRAGLHALD